MNRNLAIACLMPCLVASLAAQEVAPDRPRTQQPFDPIDPRWDHEWPFDTPAVLLQSAADVAAIPPECDELGIDMAKVPEALATVLRRERIVRLLVGNTPDAEALPWAELLRHEELRGLVLNRGAPFAAGDLRQLRQLPALESLVLSRCARLDADTVEALLELPKLRHLGLSGIPIENGALRRLAGLPELVSLGLKIDPEAQPRELLAELATLRSLRQLQLWTGGAGPAASGTMVPGTAAMVQQLAKVPQLRGVAFLGPVDDEVLAALPKSLTSLVLFPSSPFTPEGLRQLGPRGQLRSLSLHGALRPDLVAPVAEVLAASPIERFDLRAMPDEVLMKALIGLPELRWLTVQAPRGDVAAAVELASRLRRLQTLCVRTSTAPRAEDLAGLRDHATLRRVVFHHGRERFACSSAELAALRTAAGCEVEVR